jgi:hypothetical protein
MHTLMGVAMGSGVAQLVERFVGTCTMLFSPPEQHMNILEYKNGSELLLMVVLPIAVSIMFVHLFFRNFIAIIWLGFKGAIAFILTAWVRSYVAGYMSVCSSTEHSTSSTDTETWVSWLSELLY